ncbi:Mor transcription activator family protein [Anaerosporobacter sp.]
MMKEDDISGFNEAYREIAEIFGKNTAIQFYENFRGQQVVYPISLYSKSYIMKCIVDEYDGTNAKELSHRFGYTEAWLLHKIKAYKENMNK